MISFAVSEEGLVTQKKTPKGIHSVQDLGRKNVTFINREPGSGMRVLLDSALSKAGIRSSGRRNRVAYGHLAAAWQVYLGAADCCVAT